MKTHRITTVSAAIVLLALPSFALAEGGPGRPSGHDREVPTQTTPDPVPSPRPAPTPAATPRPTPTPGSAPAPTPPPKPAAPRRSDDDAPQGTTPDERGDEHAPPVGSDVRSRPAQRKAYGLACAALSKRHVAGAPRTPFSICVSALAKLDSGRTDDPDRACKGLSKKRAADKRPSPFKLCLVAAAPYVPGDDADGDSEGDAGAGTTTEPEATPTPAPTPAPAPDAS